jgi:hypothetical protein
MPKKNRIAESKLIKALAELEGIAKSDPLEEADPEGGLSTEGEPLSTAAPSGRGEKTKKSRTSASSPFGGSSSSSASSDGGDDDDDKAPPFKKKDKGKKVSKARSASSSAASSEDDDGSDDDSDAEKSFREQAEGDETLRKGMIVNDFLESMVDQISLALLSVRQGIQQSFAKSLQETEARLSARIDERVEKSSTAQQGFNARLAKAVQAIGNIVQDDLLGMADMVKSLADQPVGSPRGKAVLSKGEVNQPPWGGPSVVGADQRLASGSDDYTEQLRELSPTVISDQLFKMAANNRLDQNVILAFEADRYDVGALPAAVRKALANELIK